LNSSGAKITGNAGLLAVRELDEMMGLTDMAGDLIVEGRTGKNIQHQVSGLLRQSVYARLAGYEDTNDHEGLVTRPGDEGGHRQEGSRQDRRKFRDGITFREGDIHPG